MWHVNILARLGVVCALFVLFAYFNLCMWIRVFFILFF